MRKEELMNAAVELFKKKGFHATSVEEITASVGISKGGFYRHYHSKESLILDLLDRFYDDMMEKAEHYSTELRGDSSLILKKKITIELEQIIGYNYFFNAVMNEYSPADESPIPTSINRIFDMLSEWHKQALQETFGYTLPYMNDLVMLLEGAIHSYLGKIVREQMDLPLDMVADLIVESLQAIVMNDASISPVLPHLNENEKSNQELQIDMVECLNSLCSGEDRWNENQIETIEFLVEELKEHEPREFLVDALFTQLSKPYELKRKLAPALAAWELWKVYDE